MESGDLGVAARRRFVRQLVIGVPLLVGVVLIVAKLPPWLVERGERKADACLDAARDRDRDPASCSLGLGFDIGAWFPAMRARAQEARESVRSRVVTYTFDHAMLSHPDPARRDAAAKAFLDATEDRSWALRQAARVGAFEVVAKFDLGTLPIEDRHEAAFAALAIGDVAAARKAIASGVASDSEGAARTAALACLLGERERGLALLHDADAQARGGYGLDSAARFAAQHCGGTFETVGFDPFSVVSFHQLEAFMSRAFDPAFQAGRRTAFGLVAANQTTIWRSGLIGTFALAAGSEAELSTDKLMELITQRTGSDLDVGAPFAATPWLVLTSDDMDSNFVDYVPPAWLEVAAARYERAIPTVKKPLTSSVHDRLSVVEQTRLLRSAAVFAYLHAAGYRIRRGDRDGARTDLAKARALDAATLWRAPLELAVGDPTSALATLDAWQAQHPEDNPDLLAVVTVNRVLALAATGDHAKAYAVAGGVTTRERDWLVIATAITSGSPLPTPSEAPADDSYWLDPRAMLAAIEAKQLPADLRSFDDNDLAVLPAVITVVAHAAEVCGANPEVVLDDVFSDLMPSRAFALARAEAARWRKDQATAQTWEARAAVIDKLFVDDHAAVLGGIARVW